MKILLASILSLPLLVPAALAAEKKAQPDPAHIEATTRLQVFLDRANFGPGKIDGRGGEFTRKALERFRTVQPSASAAAAGTEANLGTRPAPVDQPRDEGAAEGRLKKEKSGSRPGGEEQLDTTGIDLQSVGEAFTRYTVTAADLENVGEVPKEPAALAKLKYVPYRSAAEAVAERFHMDFDFLKELNPAVNIEALKEGDQLVVPNVEPFDLAAVKEIKPGEAIAASAGTGEEAPVEDTDGKTSKKGTDEAGGKKEASDVTVHIDTKNKMLDVREGDRLIAAFPVTPGSGNIPTPTGKWKIKGVAKMPDFRYDKKLLKEGERSEDAHLIPPGPNNPVGVVWIALNRPGIGLHGTDDPDTIGRAASHGCVRLANWDVVKLARLVKSGVSVTID